jgi:hypothetical protein
MIVDFGGVIISGILILVINLLNRSQKRLGVGDMIFLSTGILIGMELVWLRVSYNIQK